MSIFKVKIKRTYTKTLWEIRNKVELELNCMKLLFVRISYHDFLSDLWYYIIFMIKREVGAY